MLRVQCSVGHDRREKIIIDELLAQQADVLKLSIFVQIPHRDFFVR